MILEVDPEWSRSRNGFSGSWTHQQSLCRASCKDKVTTESGVPEPEWQQKCLLWIATLGKSVQFADEKTKRIRRHQNFWYWIEIGNIVYVVTSCIHDIRKSRRLSKPMEYWQTKHNLNGREKSGVRLVPSCMFSLCQIRSVRKPNTRRHLKNFKHVLHQCQFGIRNILPATLKTLLFFSKVYAFCDDNPAKCCLFFTQTLRKRLLNCHKLKLSNNL